MLKMFNSSFPILDFIMIIMSYVIRTFYFNSGIIVAGQHPKVKWNVYQIMWHICHKNIKMIIFNVNSKFAHIYQTGIGWKNHCDHAIILLRQFWLKRLLSSVNNGKTVCEHAEKSRSWLGYYSRRPNSAAWRIFRYERW